VILFYDLPQIAYATLIHIVDLTASAQHQALVYALLVLIHHRPVHGLLLVVQERSL